MSIPHKTRQDAEDQERRQALRTKILKDITATDDRLFQHSLERFLAISDEEWQAVLDSEAEWERRRTATAEADLGEKSPPWMSLVSQGSPVMQIAHGAMMQDDLAEQTRRGELTAQRARAYQDELAIQAKRVGCPHYRGTLRLGPEWIELDKKSIEDAHSITDTYNSDLAKAINKIRTDVPTANRNTYAKRLRDWNDNRSQWKERQIAQHTDLSARNQAQRDFYRNNGIRTGMAVLRPRTAVCPICNGWINRGETPIQVALSNPGPYHPNCVPPGEPVLMADGTEKAIEDVAVGDEVLTSKGQCLVKQIFRRQTQEPVYQLFVGGRVLRVTGEHPVMTTSGWIPARDLRVGDLVHTTQGTHRVTKVEVEDYVGDVFNLETENEEYVVSGVVIHNCPHYWDVYSPEVSADDCANLWRPGIPPGRGGMPSVPEESEMPIFATTKPCRD